MKVEADTDVKLELSASVLMCVSTVAVTFPPASRFCTWLRASAEPIEKTSSELCWVMENVLAPVLDTSTEPKLMLVLLPMPVMLPELVSVAPPGPETVTDPTILPELTILP